MSGTSRRLNIPPEDARRGAALGKATQRQRYLLRVRALVEEHAFELSHLVPIDRLVAAVEPVYQQAYLRGYRRGCRVRRRAL